MVFSFSKNHFNDLFAFSSRITYLFENVNPLVRCHILFQRMRLSFNKEFLMISFFLYFYCRLYQVVLQKSHKRQFISLKNKRCVEQPQGHVPILICLGHDSLSPSGLSNISQGAIYLYLVAKTTIV